MTSSNHLYRVIRLITVNVLFITAANCQPYEIRVVNKGSGTIGVEMRVTGGTAPTKDNFITDLVFGIKWSATYNVDLLENITTSYNLKKAGVRALKNGVHFQAFAADPIGFKPLEAWVSNVWVEIMSVSNTKTGMGTGNFSIAEPGFDISTEPNFAVDFNDFTPIPSGSALNVTLPLTILNYTLTPAYNSIEIQWLTRDEQNNKGFDLERSDINNNSFITIASIDSKGNYIGDNSYSFTDKKISYRIKYYYRLKQINLNGQYKYSEIKTISLTGSEGAPVHIAPNPAKDIVQISLNINARNEEVAIAVVDSKGAHVLSKKIFISGSNKANLDITNLASGQYFVTISKKNEFIITDTFIKK